MARSGPATATAPEPEHRNLASGIPSDDDLKQRFVYNELLGAPRSVLLYPWTSTSQDVTGTYAARRHGCEQRYVDLSDGRTVSSRVITQQLVQLLSELPA